MDVYSQFLSLPPAASVGAYSAISLGDGIRQDFLAKSIDGAPTFLLQDLGPVTFAPPATLLHVAVQFHVICNVRAADRSISEGQFVVLSCSPSVPELHELFIRCVLPAIERLPEEAVTVDIDRCIQGLFDLFRSISAPGKQEVIGLWAELFAISRSPDIRATMEAWHASYFETFDFSWPYAVLEVKAAQGQERAHMFSLDQLVVPQSGNGFVLSMLVQPMTGGLGILDLAGKIEASLRDSIQLKERLWKNIASALGGEFGEKLDRRFDPQFADRHVVVFHMRDIPAPDRPLDPRVSGVRFRSSLSSIASSVAGEPRKVLERILVNGGCN